MAHRTPTSGNGKADPDADTVIHEATQEFVTFEHEPTTEVEFRVPEHGRYDPCGPNGKHRHGDDAAHLHQQGNRPHDHDDDSGIVVFHKTPAAAGNPDGGDGWFLSRVDQPPADPDPAPDASAPRETRDGDDAGPGRPPSRDGKGRFLAKPTIPPMGAGLAQALLDASAEVHRVNNTTHTAGLLVAAVAFSDHVRHDGGEAS